MGSKAAGLVTANTFLAALAQARHQTWPYDYWLFENALPEAVCESVVGLPFAPPDAPSFDGRRESNNATRVYFSPGVQTRFPACREIAEAFKAADTRRAIAQATGADLSRGLLRIEYCQDGDGFWLEPHVDIPVKLFTMLIYLSREPELIDAGTDIYDDTSEHRLIARAPCRWNAGLIFIPGRNTWHGLARRPIRGVRKSLIINYVTPEWRATEELA